MRQDSSKSVEVFIDKINVLSRKELEHQLPLAQNSLLRTKLEAPSFKILGYHPFPRRMILGLS